MKDTRKCVVRHDQKEAKRKVEAIHTVLYTRNFANLAGSLAGTSFEGYSKQFIPRSLLILPFSSSLPFLSAIVCSFTLADFPNQHLQCTDPLSSHHLYFFVWVDIQ
jgi:hypothetical protein